MKRFDPDPEYYQKHAGHHKRSRDEDRGERRERSNSSHGNGERGRGGGEGESSRGGNGGRGTSRGGNGGGNGGRGGATGGDGRRGVRRERYFPSTQERMDAVVSRPTAYVGNNGKRGKSGYHVDLLANFFVLRKRPDWCIFNYRVDFKPEEERTHVKKSLLKVHSASIGSYIFDGSTLYTANRLTPDPLQLYSVRDSDNEKVEVTVRLVQELAPGDVMYLQFFNITVRKCMSAMKLEELGRHFYDREKAIKMTALRLELWPGYITSMRNYENNVLLCVEVTHKVLRQETVLDVINQLRRDGREEQAIKDELVGTIVMTHYNRKTYRVDDIDWASNPLSSFERGKNGERQTYGDYYRERYKIRIENTRQPLLVSRPKKRDVHRGQSGPILLIPEFCQMTGLSDSMRSNFQMMKELSAHLQMGPQSRMESVQKFMRRLKTTPEVREDLQLWGLDFSTDLVSFPGRVLAQESILFDNAKEDPDPQRKADWTMAFRSKRLFSTTDLRSWVIIVPQRDSHGIDNLIKIMQQVSRPLNFRIAPPTEVINLPNIQIQNYVKQIDQAMANYGQSRNLQLIFVVLPTNKLETYSAVKRRCVVDYGISSQCYLTRNVKAKNLMAIATKCVVQMSAKLGGEPWSVSNPIKTAMIIGFDVYHCGKRKGRSVGAMVATTTKTFAKYYSTVSFHNNKEELSTNVCQDITKCLNAYRHHNNGDLPDRIIMYRDGVGDGQLTFVYGTELEQIKNAMRLVYDGARRSLPKFSFIVVTKKINTRIFSGGRQMSGNPDPGTIVDDIITLPERFDFYLIAQSVRQGTVSPTSYNVLFDQQGFEPDQIQRLSYKLCHMYFNWSGTVAVPAPCQYAHKLAYLTGMALDNEPHERLSHLLYYL